MVVHLIKTQCYNTILRPPKEDMGGQQQHQQITTGFLNHRRQQQFLLPLPTPHPTSASLNAVTTTTLATSTVIIDQQPSPATTTFPQNQILACSPASPKQQHHPIILPQLSQNNKRSLLSDRKKPFEHLKPRPLVLSAARTVVQQGGLFLVNFMSDQLNFEMLNDRLVADKLMTEDDAALAKDQWEEREWSQRINALPQKTITSFIKLQSATLLMRLYEHIASLYVSTVTLDKLTMDIFQAAKRCGTTTADRRLVTTTESTTSESSSQRRCFDRMYRTCLWGNFISFLSDYTVQQVILLGGAYAIYVTKRSHNRKSKDDDDESRTALTQPAAETTGGTLLLLTLKSCRLIFSRGMAWWLAGVGGAVGSVLYPGYGTLFGVTLGDNIVSSLLD